MGRFLTFALLLLGAGAAMGQTNQTGPGGKRAALIIASDVPCTVRLDGETVAELQPDAPAKLLVVPGQYLLAAVSADGQRWSKAVTVKGPKTVIKIEFVQATASPARPASTIPATPKAPRYVESADGPGIEFVDPFSDLNASLRQLLPQLVITERISDTATHVELVLETTRVQEISISEDCRLSLFTSKQEDWVDKSLFRKYSWGPIPVDTLVLAKAHVGNPNDWSNAKMQFSTTGAFLSVPLTLQTSQSVTTDIQPRTGTRSTKTEQRALFIVLFPMSSAAVDAPLRLILERAVSLCNKR